MAQASTPQEDLLRNFGKEFKEFINRGNLVELAVAFVLGVAFAGVIKAFVDNIVMPIVAIPFGKPNFDQALILTINDAQIRIGAFITAFVNFVLIALVLFLIIKAYNRFREGAASGPTEVELLTEIRDALNRRP